MGKTTKNILTMIIFLSVISSIGAYYYGKPGQEVKASSISKENKTQSIPVVLSQVQTHSFQESLRVHGSLKSKYFSLVSPRIAGVIEEIFVREGNDVVAGQTKIFQTDSLKLSKMVEMNRQSLNVVRCERQEKEASLEKVEIELRKAEKDYKRYKELYDRKTVSQDVYEERGSVYYQLVAMKKLAMSQLALKVEEEKKEEALLSISQKELRDSLMLAPINGKVSKRMAEPGEMGTPGVPIIRIDDTETLEAITYIPSQYYSQVIVNETFVEIKSHNVFFGKYKISYKSPVVDNTMRTFEIKCELKGDNKKIIPGYLVEMDIILASKTGLGVPWEAVQERTGKKMVFLAKDMMALGVNVYTGIETNGWLEIAGDGIKEGTNIVVQGQFLLNSGTPIQILKGQN